MQTRSYLPALWERRLYAFEAIKKNSFCHCPTSLTVSDLESSAVFLPPSAPQERLQTRHSIEGAGESDPRSPASD